jgi:hypothetical protein
MLKNASEVIIVPKKKNFFFLKIVNFVQSFLECKVSLADGTYLGKMKSSSLMNLGVTMEKHRVYLHSIYSCIHGLRLGCVEK